MPTFKFRDELAISQLTTKDNAKSKQLEYLLLKSGLEEGNIITVFQKLAQIEHPTVESSNLMPLVPLLVGHLRLVGPELLINIDGLGMDRVHIISKLFNLPLV